MSKTVIIHLEFDDEEYQEALDREDVQGNLSSWFFGELCQNQSMGFITHFQVKED